MGHLSRFFTAEELRCGCGCGFGTRYSHFIPSILKRADMIRDYIDRPLHISSGARCAAHNTRVGGVRNSSHTIGAAIDFRVASGPERLDIVDAALYLGGLYGVKRVGVADTFVHVDTDLTKRNAVWTY